MSFNSTKKESDAKGNLDLRPGLYLVATPIGNLRDMTLRALDALEGCDLIVCEDTRQSRKLLQAYGIDKPLFVYNDHAGEKQRRAVFENIEDGKSVVLISDAGMPLISDPGYKLVREALEAGHYVTSLPGANAPLMALQLSGLPSDSFSFGGFLPAKDKARRDVLKVWADVPSTLIFFETAPRLVEALKAMRDVLGEREVCVLRELTKMYEEGRRGGLPELIAYYEEAGPPKGELVIVVSPLEQESVSDAQVKSALERALQDMSVKQASSLVADIFGLKKKDLYDLALKIEKAGE